MNKRPSIRLGKTLQDLLTSLKGDDDNVSAIINDMADKYFIVVEQCKPDLTRDEWLSLCAAYNGHFFREGYEGMLGEVRSMEWLVSEWIKYSPGEAGQLDNSKLREKIEQLGYAERVSILYHVKLFWTRGSNFNMFDEIE